MKWFQNTRPKEKERYYLLPGMGGRAYRRKQKVILRYTFAFSAVVCVIFAYVLYVVSKSQK